VNLRTGALNASNLMEQTPSEEANSCSASQQILRPLKYYYEGESNENRKIFFRFNLLNESGTQLYHFST
jgi:hypothetical protein